MVKLFFFLFSLLTTIAVVAQPPSKEELEKQKAQLKKEIEETERLLNDNKIKTKESFVQWKLVNDRVNQQDRVIDNITKDIDLLDNNMYTVQRDINKYNRLLDTLKQEYAKSMVYAYKNRSNYDFLNFIFSASSFNDAIKRISYLKSYRKYREMQGQNILRMQELRRRRMEEITGIKQQKAVVLDDKSKEMDKLEFQKKEKDRILAELKKKGKSLSNQIAATKKKYQKVNSLIAAAIEKARKEAIAKAKAEAEKNKPATPAVVTTPGTKPTAKIKSPTPEKDIFNTEENKVLNVKFENNRRQLPWPVDKGYILLRFGPNTLPGTETELINPGLTIATDIGAPVKCVFDGKVLNIVTIEEGQAVIVQHGKYFTTYDNLSGIAVRVGQEIKTGQLLGKAMANLDGVGAITFVMSNEKSNFDPAAWLRPR
jgi:septal ring factor EnvC (AmiA/AmiB activator)